MIPRVSLVVCCYNMRRELPRTLLSMSPAMQRGVSGADYEIVLVDNGSSEPVDPASFRNLGVDIRLVRIDDASISPAAAMNRGIATARAPLVGALIDGARMASPGLVHGALLAGRIAERTVIITLGFHLGPKVQMVSVAEGYDQAAEDRLLRDCRWEEDGYRLFGVSVLAGSSGGGWFAPISESNALFMPRSLWNELGGFDERFQSPGGGYVNLDMLTRALDLPEVQPVTLLGEATFHQVHGGAATNAPASARIPMRDEYQRIRGRPFRTTQYRSVYLGSIDKAALGSIAESAERARTNR